METNRLFWPLILLRLIAAFVFWSVAIGLVVAWVFLTLDLKPDVSLCVYAGMTMAMFIVINGRRFEKVLDGRP